MDAGEFRAGNVAGGARLPGPLRFRSSTCCKPTAQSRRDSRCRGGGADRGAHGRQEGAETSRAPTRSASSFWSRASSWKTPRAACAGRGNRPLKIHTKAVHAGDRKKPGDARSRHHADPHGVELLLRVDGAARPRLRPGGGRATATRATTIRRPRALEELMTRARRRRTARWPALRGWRRCTSAMLTRADGPAASRCWRRTRCTARRSAC